MITCSCYAQQTQSDEKLLNDVVPYLVNRIEATATYYIEEKPCVFFNQQKFFTEPNFEFFTHKRLGSDSCAVKKLLRKLDFDYLANYKPDTTKWNLTNVKHKQIVEKGVKGGYCEIAKPIFSKDNKYMFIYFQRSHKASSGASTFSSSNVAVFKKKKNKWIFYTYIGMAV
jgi:hypothetical protein